jgi:hypothetical protein
MTSTTNIDSILSLHLKPGIFRIRITGNNTIMGCRLIKFSSMMLSRCLLVVLFLCVSLSSFGQEKKQKGVLRDTLDGALDLSSFLIDMNGFIPMPFIITEPALGGAGGGLALIFLKRRPPQIDSIGNVRKVIRMPPDITGGGGMYTSNDSWAGMALRSGSWVKSRLKYRIIGGYANINLSYYRTLADGQEHEVQFNFKTVPLIGYLMKQFKGTYWSAGVQYTFLATKVGFDPSTPALDFVEAKELDSYVSMPGILVEFDKRDNVFTPDKGIRFSFSTGFSNNSFGSDYDYTNLNTLAYGYQPLRSNVIGGLRVGFQQVFGDTPFYLLPYIDLRGIPLARYQGEITSVVEAEVRWDFVPRWSVVGFTGTGKAFDSWSEFNDSDYRFTAGGGFRYLIARLFKIRMGVDVAHGPEQWAYYIVFGSSWLR